jgi:cytochrome c553
MSEFRSRTRPATVMRQIAQGYTEEQIRRIAEYFSKQAAK